MIPSEKMSLDRVFFSETRSRYLLVVNKSDLQELEKQLEQSGITHGVIGTFGGDQLIFEDQNITDLRVDKVRQIWMRSLEEKI